MILLPKEIETCGFCKHFHVSPLGISCLYHDIPVESRNACENFDIAEGNELISGMSKEIIKAYCHLRATTSDISTEALDWMKSESLFALVKLRK